MYCNSCYEEFDASGDLCPKCGKNVRQMVPFKPQVVRGSNSTAKQIGVGCLFLVIFIVLAVGITFSSFIDSITRW